MTKELENRFKQIERASKQQFESSLHEYITNGYMDDAVIPLLTIVKELVNQNEELRERVNQLENNYDRNHSLM